MTAPHAQHQRQLVLKWVLLLSVLSVSFGFHSISPPAPLHAPSFRWNTYDCKPHGSFSLSAVKVKTSDDDSTTSTTLYDILGASPDDSRAELKRRYAQLARQTHPDAMIRRNRNNNSTATSTSSTTSTTEHSFSDIAEAYRVLSDAKLKKRYDRELAAAAFSRHVSQMASDWTEQAAPKVSSMLDTIAVPFLRRTTATTLAGIQAVATRPTTEDVVVSAMKAAQKAGRMVDDLELLEQSEALEAQLQEQLDQAQALKAQLDNTSLRRVQMALQTPNATISTHDAWSLLQHWKQQQQQHHSNDTSTTTSKNKNNKQIPVVEQKITDWTTIQQELETTNQRVDQLVTKYQDSERALQQARAQKVMALQEQKRAREALERAKRNVAATNQQVNAATKDLAQAAVALETKSHERHKLEQKYQKQHTAVAATLHKSSKQKSLGVVVPLVVRNNTDSSQNEEEEEDLEALQEKERQLLQEYKQLEIQANKLQQQANKLKDKAQKINQTQAAKP
ncbi:DnaJ domain [Seminavis robusta]|uniref:DnaJ domain n=1 Tax=Seminavis robusta TaxID=568900 RepID=A0A9N8ERF6_9STRA|nr:DnaJ domain [Seminavis robusta]|eukprot:Sro1571_g283350.1 DnaJ domain (507) ;mRNA; f:14812-16332